MNGNSSCLSSFFAYLCGVVVTICEGVNFGNLKNSEGSAKNPGTNLGEIYTLLGCGIGWNIFTFTCALFVRRKSKHNYRLAEGLRNLDATGLRNLDATG